MDQQFIVCSSPFMRSKNDINRMFLYVALALVFPTIYGVVLFGIRSIFVVLASVISCFVFEMAYTFFDTKKLMLNNMSFLITGLILGLTLPYKTPLILVIFCAFIATVIVKLSFGGVGRNYFNPACTARCIAGMVLPGMASELYTVTLAGDEYVSLLSGGTNTLYNLFSGQAVGGIGTTCVLLLLFCFIGLSYMQVIEIKIPVLAVISYIVTSLLFFDMETAMMNLCSGSFVFTTVFIITDPNTSPNTLLGKIIYSVMFGALSALAWKVGAMGENTVFAVAVLVNLFVPFMDKYLVARPATLGGYRNAHKD